MGLVVCLVAMGLEHTWKLVPMFDILLAESSSALLPARNQMAVSLGWHIVLACFGMAWPAIIFVMHRRGLKGDADSLELAKRWSKVAGVLFAIGAVSGTILSFEMGLLWPGLMEKFGDVVGLAFALEGISFFTEAIFLGLYIYSWDKLPGKLHSLMLIPIVVSGIFGSFFVVSVNAWMNAPSGFEMVGDVVTDIDPLAAIFNSSVWLQSLHMFFAAYMIVGFCVAGVYAVGILKGRNDRLHRIGVAIPLLFAAAATVGQPIVGHFAAQRLADEQPIKLAAMEGIAENEIRAPLKIGGVFVDGELKGALTLPIDGLLSFNAQNNFDAEVVGLNSVPEDKRPPVNIVRFSFQIMLAIGFSLVGLVLWAFLRIWRSKDFFADKKILKAIVLAGPAAVVALETGWITTEVGRQPWIVYQHMETFEAVTDSNFIWLTFAILVIVYAGMTWGAYTVIRSMSRRWAAGEKNLAAPYGPALPLEATPDRRILGVEK